MTIATFENLPKIKSQYNSLAAIALLSRVFITEDNTLDNNSTIKHWFTGQIINAFKSYEDILILLQKHEQQDQVKQGGLILHYLDIPRCLESLISIANRLCTGIKVFGKENVRFYEFVTKYESVIILILKLRNDYEHFNKYLKTTQITDGEVDIIFSDSGKIIKFRKISISTLELINFLDELFNMICTFYPNINLENSNINNVGNLKLSISLDIDSK